MAKRTEAKNQRKKNEALSLLFAVGIALTLRWAIAEAYVIPSGSMLPTLLIHDHIFINKLIYGIRIPFSKTWLVKFGEPKRGDIIVFKSPRDGINLIKRVIGVPGDKLRYDSTNLYINDKLVPSGPTTDMSDFNWLRDEDLERPKADHQLLTEDLLGTKHPVMHLTGNMERSQEEITIPPGSLFMMGDHRDNSADSRFWGLAPMDNVLGKAMFVWLSCDDALPIPKLHDVGCNPLTIRWARFFHSVK